MNTKVKFSGFSICRQPFQVVARLLEKKGRRKVQKDFQVNFLVITLDVFFPFAWPPWLNCAHSRVF